MFCIRMLSNIDTIYHTLAVVHGGLPGEGLGSSYMKLLIKGWQSVGETEEILLCINEHACFCLETKNHGVLIQES